jgi:hypothetical protein
MLLRDHILFALRVINGRAVKYHSKKKRDTNERMRVSEECFSWKFTERTSNEEGGRERMQIVCEYKLKFYDYLSRMYLLIIAAGL